VHAMRPTVVGFIVSIALTPFGAGPVLAAAPDCEAARRAVQGQIDAACPCEGATTHADYVRCVTKELRGLSECTSDPNGARACGPVPRSCFGSLRKLASRSTCGDSTGVTCCIPRPHDCVGDAKPGDGKADGVCSQSTRPCDRVTDCLLPKCSVTGSEENCRLLGGTPGTSKNCTTACIP